MSAITRLRVGSLTAIGAALCLIGVTVVLVPEADAAAVRAGRWENNSSAVSLQGPWTTSSSTSDSGGSSSSLATDGFAEITFAATAVKWITRTNNVSGIADVYIDGVKKSAVDLYTSTTKTQQVVYEVNGLTDTDHVLRIIRTGTKNAASGGRNISLDAIDVPDLVAPSAPAGVAAVAESTGARITWTANTETDLAGYRVYRLIANSADKVLATSELVTTTGYLDEGLQPGTPHRFQVTAVDTYGNESPLSAEAAMTTRIDPVGEGTYENDSPRVTLSGAWSLNASTGANTDSGGSYAALGGVGYAEISFRTSGIRWLARTNSASGQADVYLDGVKKATVDLYSATVRYKVLAYEIADLPETNHTLRIVRTGTKSDASVGRNITLDAFVAPDIHAPAAPTGVRATMDGTSAVVTWSANDEADVSAYRIFRAESSTAVPTTRIAVTDAATLTFTDPGLNPGTVYRYTVVAVDTSDNASAPSAIATLSVAIAAQGEGTYENDSPEVTLSGAWTQSASSMDSGGSFATLGSAGYAELSFRTSGIRWIARTNAVAGIADVYLDGVKKASVDLYSSSTQYQQLVYEISGLSETPHTLRIVRTGTRNPNSGGANVILDAFVAPDIYPPAAPGAPQAVPEATGARVSWPANGEADVIGYRLYRQPATSGPIVAVNSDLVTTPSYLDTGLQPGSDYRYRVTAIDSGGNESPVSVWAAVTTTINAVGQGTYQNDDPAVTLSGPWTTVRSNQDSGGSYANLATTGYAEISFTTSGLKWLTRTNQYAGIADVYLDGVKVQAVDLYSSFTQYQQVVYEVSGLSETDHTLRIVRTDARNPDSAGGNVLLDAFVAPDIHAPSAPSDLTATADGTGAKLTWNRSPESDIAGYRVYRRTEGVGANVLIGNTDAATRTFSDPGLRPGTQYQYTVTALDTSDNASEQSEVASLTTPISAQGAGTYENTSTALTYVGNWSTTAASSDSGGSFATLSATGYVELSFSASGVKWIARTNAYAGIADVYLDGVKKATADLYSSTTKYQQVVYEISGLTESAHTIRIVRTGSRNAASGGGNIMLDAFNVPDIYPPTPPTALTATPEGTGARLGWHPSTSPDTVGYKIYRQLGDSGAINRITPNPVSDLYFLDTGLQPGTGYHYFVVAFDSGGNESTLSSPAPVTTNISAVGNGLYENDSARVTLSGNWTKNNSTGANTDSGGSYAILNTTGYAELSFTTSGVKWLARTNPFSGQADVYLDGVKKATVDLYSSATKYQQVVYQIAGLPEVPHTIRVVRTGTRNASSGGSNITVDAFSAPDIYPPASPAGLAITPSGTGALVSWMANTENDLAGYQVLRAEAGASFFTQIGITDAVATSFADVGLPDATTYRYQLIARDTSDNMSPATAPVSFTSPLEPATSPLRYSRCPAATATVSTRAELVAAINASAPGTVIRLNPGSYTGRYEISNRNGTEAKPIWICGSRAAVLDGYGTGTNSGVRIDSSSHVVLTGMTVRNSAKGITVINSSNITIADTRVATIGEEAIHLRTNTTDSTVIGNTISDTGLMTPMYGEAIYVGTAEPNWCSYSNCLPDASDRNTIVLNTISNTTAEPIEAKEGATNGLISRNSIDGTGMSEHSDSLIAIQSNGWVVSKNTGSNAPLDGLQVWEQGPGWGMNNIAYANHFDHAVPGYAVRLPYNELGNVVGCDNTIGNPSWGVSNKPCQY